MKPVNLLKSILHNVGVLIVGFGFASLGALLDYLVNACEFRSVFTLATGSLFVTLGFLLRVWATVHFYEHHMKVISLVPQGKLIRSGPYRFSRNPLYLGGNVFIFLGAVLVFGSPSGLLLTALNILAVDFMIRREEKQLERIFGEEWVSYRNQVRRWV
jgi:protein-S-isoprenylcysteine O-methyltransferase Ste14